jgi:hypothetical protein
MISIQKYLRILLIAETEAKAKEMCLWLCKGEEEEGIYKKHYEVSRNLDISVMPFWKGCQNDKPESIQAVIVHYMEEKELPQVKSIVEDYQDIPIKILLTPGKISKKFEDMWKLQGMKQQDQEDLIEYLIEANNNLIKVLKEVFDSFDLDNSGFIDLHEIKAVAKKLGSEIAEGEAQLIMKELDTNKDGKISFEEFTNWWRSGRKGKSFAFKKLMRMQVFASAALKRSVEALKSAGAFDEIEISGDDDIVADQISFQINKIKNPGILIALRILFEGAMLSGFEEMHEGIFGLPKDAFYLSIGFSSKNPSASATRFKKLLDQMISFISAVDLNFESMLNMVKYDVKYTDDKVYLCVHPEEMMAEQFKATFEMACPPILEKTLNTTIEFFLQFGTDLKRLNIEDKPMYAHLFEGILLEVKSTKKGNLAGAFLSQVTSHPIFAQAKMHMPLPGDVFDKMFKPLLNARVSGEVEFEIDEELQKTIFDKVESEQEQFNLAFPDLKATAQDELMDQIKQFPLGKKILDFCKEEIEDIDLFIHAPHLAIKLEIKLPGLGDILTLE